MSINPQFLPESKPTEEWRQHLWAAADYIRQYGHSKGSLCAHDGSGVCVRGAILVAMYGQPKWPGSGSIPDDFRAVERHVSAMLGLEDQIPGANSLLVDWNNAPERKTQEVIAALEKAALS